MENELDFATNQFGINEQGIHLLRNRYTYESISYNEIQSCSIKKGPEFKNWVIMLVFGSALLAFAVHHIYELWIFFNSEEGGAIYIESLIIPFFPTIIGLLIVYLSFRKTLVFDIKTRKKSYYLSFRPFMKNNTLPEVEKFLESQIPGLQKRNKG